MSDFGNYRRDLAVLDPAGGRSTQQHGGTNNPASGSLGQIAPWMAGNGGGSIAIPGPPATSFYNDSSDNLSLGSQLSPGLRSLNVRGQGQTPATSTDSHDTAYFNDERRPSIASITTTASSQGSKASATRGGFRKLQGFFGEEFPGRDSSETSLPNAQGKEHRSHSYTHGRTGRDRHHSNATDHTREASPASSRPRTPVPAPEVVPFLYQEAEVCHVPYDLLRVVFLPQLYLFLSITVLNGARQNILTNFRILRGSAKPQSEIAWQVRIENDILPKTLRGNLLRLRRPAGQVIL
jgi:adenylate cyclase